MQPLTAAPRDALTEAQVRGLLANSASVTVRAGAELLGLDLAVRQDISDNLLGGSVERVMHAPIHGTCKLQLDTELPWSSTLVRPYMELSADGVTARWTVGVFSLTTPAERVNESPTTYDVQGYDRLVLLAREVGDSYSVAAGTGYLAAVTAAVAAAGLTGVQLDSSAAAKTLPADRTWPILAETTPTTWLGIVNDLLAAIGYRGMYADNDGLLRSEPYADPAARAPEYVLPAYGDRSLIGEVREQTTDLWNAPNRWVFVQQNAPAAPVAGAGLYVVTNQSDGPTSIDQRGLTWTKTLQVDAADQGSLQTRGDAVVAADRRATRTLKVRTVPWPAAGHADVYTYDDPALGGAVKVQARQYQLDLTGADTEWLLEVIG